MFILGIETSCDETAAAVVKDDGLVLSDVIHSQIKLHAPYGGIVPELASRDHMKNIRPVIEMALTEAKLALSDVDGISVTCQPGLSGALLVGIQAAKGIAFARGLPVVGVDHLMGHLMAVFLRHEAADVRKPQFPFVALIVSGGHTALYRVEGPALSDIRELGATRDDAAGEAFDKVAKLLGLGYPGGPIIDRLSAEGDPTQVPLSRPMPGRNTLEFSFSGLKTNVMRYVNENGLPSDGASLRNLCAAFQTRVVDTLVKKAVLAVRAERLSTLVIGGGVAANSQLRAALRKACERYQIELFVPELRACTDNAAMIAYAGRHRLMCGQTDAAGLTMSPHTALNSVTRKGPGRRARPA